MLSCFNNGWVLLIGVILLYFIIKKIYNLNKPFDEKKFIEQYANQKKLKNKINIELFKQGIPQLASYYVGLH